MALQIATISELSRRLHVPGFISALLTVTILVIGFRDSMDTSVVICLFRFGFTVIMLIAITCRMCRSLQCLANLLLGGW